MMLLQNTLTSKETPDEGLKVRSGEEVILCQKSSKIAQSGEPDGTLDAQSVLFC